MNLEELEQEIRLHRRGRRREVLILVGIGAVAASVLAAALMLSV